MSSAAAMATPRALIFDMDGLMIDSEPLWLSVERGVAAEHGGNWTDAMAHSCVGTGLPNTAATMRRELGIDWSDEEGVARLVGDFISRASELVLKPGLLELLDAADAAGLQKAVATSSTRALLDAVMDGFALRQRFDVLVCGDDVAQQKPAPDIFVLAAERLGRAPADLVVLEDSHAGVRAAVAAEIRVIAVPEGHAERFLALTPHVVTDLHEARRILGL